MAMEAGTEHAIAHDGLANGWPLGLHLLSNARISTNPAGTAATEPEGIHIRSLSDVGGSYLASATSSVTSDSSSDLDTESTASFFPERSTTLGSLIGLQSRSQTPQRQTMIPIHQLVQEDNRTLKRKNGRASGTSSMSRGGRALCPLLSCGSASLAQEEKMGMSPSLAHLLERERRSISGYPVEHANTLFDNEGILPPSSGAPLRLMLQQPHLDAPYVSSDWHVYHNKAHDATSNHGIWPGFCFKQSTNFAN